MDDHIRNLLRALGGSTESNALGGGSLPGTFGGLAPTPWSGAFASAPSPLGNALSSHANPPLSTLPSTLAGTYHPPGMFGTIPPATALNPIARPVPSVVPLTKRKVYFSFDFDDLLRVNNIRQAGKVGNERRDFYDRSIWESRNIREEKTLKRLMRAAVMHSSTVCVLIGSETWRSRWVKYEIARAIVDNRGLVAIHINSINHHARRCPDSRGYNPLNIMGISRSENGRFYLYEKRVVIADCSSGELGWQWIPYQDHTDPVHCPTYLPAPNTGFVIPLTRGCDTYDYIEDAGRLNIGGWIDAAARKVGR